MLKLKKIIPAPKGLILLTLHPPISPLTSSGQRNRASWASQPQKSVTLLPCPGGKTTKSTRTCGGIGGKKNILPSTAPRDRHTNTATCATCVSVVGTSFPFSSAVKRKRWSVNKRPSRIYSVRATWHCSCHWYRSNSDATWRRAITLQCESQIDSGARVSIVLCTWRIGTEHISNIHWFMKTRHGMKMSGEWYLYWLGHVIGFCAQLRPEVICNWEILTSRRLFSVICSCKLTFGL